MFLACRSHQLWHHLQQGSTPDRLTAADHAQRRQLLHGAMHSCTCLPPALLPCSRSACICACLSHQGAHRDHICKRYESGIARTVEPASALLKPSYCSPLHQTRACLSRGGCTLLLIKAHDNPAGCAASPLCHSLPACIGSSLHAEGLMLGQSDRTCQMG